MRVMGPTVRHVGKHLRDCGWVEDDVCDGVLELVPDWLVRAAAGVRRRGKKGKEGGKGTMRSISPCEGGHRRKKEAAGKGRSGDWVVGGRSDTVAEASAVGVDGVDGVDRYAWGVWWRCAVTRTAVGLSRVGVWVI